MKTYGTVVLRDTSFLFSALEVSSQLHAPAALSLRKLCPVSIAYEAGWAPRRRKKIFSLAGNSTPSI
jgi:hypothetical protein